MRRYERECAGELIHIDIKKLGKFNRITGVRSEQNRTEEPLLASASAPSMICIVCGKDYGASETAPYKS